MTLKKKYCLQLQVSGTTFTILEEIFVYKTDRSAVFYRTAEDFYEFAMAHRVEEAFKVEVYYIYVAFVDYPLRSS